MKVLTLFLSVAFLLVQQIATVRVDEGEDDDRGTDEQLDKSAEVAHNSDAKELKLDTLKVDAQKAKEAVSEALAAKDRAEDELLRLDAVNSKEDGHDGKLRKIERQGQASDRMPSRAVSHLKAEHQSKGHDDRSFIVIRRGGDIRTEHEGPDSAPGDPLAPCMTKDEHHVMGNLIVFLGLASVFLFLRLAYITCCSDRVKCRVITDKKVGILMEPDVFAEVLGYLPPGAVFYASDKVQGPDSRIYYQLEDGRGWVPLCSRKDASKVLLQPDDGEVVPTKTAAGADAVSDDDKA